MAGLYLLAAGHYRPPISLAGSQAEVHQKFRSAGRAPGFSGPGQNVDIYVKAAYAGEMNEEGLPVSFTADGVLPAMDFELTIDQLASSMLVHGPSGDVRSANWDSAWRRTLVENLSIMCSQLRQVGITEVFVNGSFVEDKDHPNDIDGYFECDLRFLASGQLERELNLIDPLKVWTWDPAHRRPYRGYPKRQLPMWHAYRVELYPHYGQMSGIRDRYDHELEFPSAFRQRRRDGHAKGIVKIRGMT